MKLTRLGRKQLRDMRHRTSALWAWPQHYEDAVAELCPHPTTGLRIAWLLAKVAEPSEVAATGFNFLGALGGGDPTSWWKDEKLQEWCPGSRSDMHDGARELQAFEALGYVLQDEQWWEAELSS